MATVYILHTAKLNIFYIGSCLDIEKRLLQHKQNAFIKGFTARAADWILFFTIDNLGYQQARSIENHIKRMKSKTYIGNLIKYPEMVEKLKLKYCVGSCR